MFMRNVLIFLVGFITCILAFGILSFLQANNELPAGLGILGSNINNATAPGDWIKLDQIQVTGDEIIIKVKNASLSSYAPTGSMRPVLDSNSNGIRIVPQSPEDINVGDIVTFSYNGENIVHRVVEKGSDNEGIWFITKGDNNNANDGIKVRFNDIKYITIGILY